MREKSKKAPPTLKLCRPLSASQIPHSHRAILARRANDAILTVGNSQDRHVAVLGGQTSLAARFEPARVQKREALVRRDGCETGRRSVDV